MARMSRLATVVGAALALASFAGVAGGVNPPHSPDDHFLCYKSRQAASFDAVSNVTLADQFESGTFTIRRHSFPGSQICPPADKNGEGIVDPNTHLLAFEIQEPGPGQVIPTAAPRSNIRVVNQFDDVNVDIGRVAELLVPANKSVAPNPPPPAPDLGTINVDHFKCYLAKISRGQARLARKQATLGTQFETRKYNLTRVMRLCTPVDKNGGGIKNPYGHLLCYRARHARGEARHVPTQVSTNDSEFGVLQLETVVERMLCVPSLKNPAPPVCGDNFQQLGEGCDGTDSPACPGQCINGFPMASDNNVCDCPGPHPFVIGAGSILNGRGALGHDLNPPAVPLSGTFQLINAPETPPGSGVFPLLVPPLTLPPGSGLGLNVCTYMVDNGSGFAGQGLVNCFGVPVSSPPSQDYTLYKDHCTGCESCDSGQRPGVCNCASGADCSTGICSGGFCFSGCGGGPPPAQGSCPNPTQACSGGVGVCLCSVDADCPAGETCPKPWFAGGGACVKTCVTTANCTAPAPTFTCTVTPNSCPGGPATTLGCGGTPFDVLHNSVSNNGMANHGDSADVCVTALPIDPPPCDNVFPPGCSGPSCLSKASAETGQCGTCSGGSCTSTTGTCTKDSQCMTGEVCLGHCSTSTGTVCHDDTDCPGAETCGSPTPHDGICNSPNDFIPGKQGAPPSWSAQNAFISINMAIKVQSTPCSAHAGTCKKDPTQDCDRDSDCTNMPPDHCLTGAQPFPFTTGRAASAIMDWDAMQGQVQGLAHDGMPFDCVQLLNSVTSGASLVMTAPALDQTTQLSPTSALTNDINVGIKMNAQ
jgi:hypothetical protein